MAQTASDLDVDLKRIASSREKIGDGRYACACRASLTESGRGRGYIVSPVGGMTRLKGSDCGVRRLPNPVPSLCDSARGFGDRGLTSSAIAVLPLCGSSITAFAFGNGKGAPVDYDRFFTTTKSLNREQHNHKQSTSSTYRIIRILTVSGSCTTPNAGGPMVTKMIKLMPRGNFGLPCRKYAGA